MKVKFLFPFLIFSLVCCTKNETDVHIDVPTEVGQHMLLPKISKDIVTLSSDDAVKVANIFTKSNAITKSVAVKEVKSVVPIMDTSGEVLMYAVNYEDGYIIISATKKYHPVLAVVDHGTYTGEQTNTGQDVLMCEFMLATKAAMDGEISIEGDPWFMYEANSTDNLMATKVSDDYTSVANDYIEEWYMSGYNIYLLYEQPENMPDELYETFCDYARDYDRPDHDYMECSFIVENPTPYLDRQECILQTSWGQALGYNYDVPGELDLGCTTIAIGQIMKYLEYPDTINWNLITNTLPISGNPHLTYFLAELRKKIGVYNDGNASMTQVVNALSQHYGFSVSDDSDDSDEYELSIVSHSQVSVKASLKNGIPVYMRGTDNNLDVGHAWVCDGYYTTHQQTEYKLFVIPMGSSEITYLENIYSTYIYPDSFTISNYFHMNWGHYGSHNGYFYQDAVGSSLGNFNAERMNLIITNNE